MILKNKIQSLSKDYFGEIREIRRQLHRYPELSYMEFKTSEFIKKFLKNNSIPYTDGYLKTGIVAKICFQNPDKKVVALRADMDALPIQEKVNIDYKSEYSNVMHACGHDFHMASLLGTAKILKSLETMLEGTVLLIFQPAEEKLPGGAKALIDSGALNNPKPDIVIGQHVMPEMESGKVGFKIGKYMASTDEIYINVSGKGGHAAMPHEINDTILIASHIIVSLQQIISRNTPAWIPSVLSFGKIEALGATNIIPSEVKIQGTLRTMDENWRTQLHSKIKEMAMAIAAGMGAKCEIVIEQGYPCLENNEEITKKSVLLAKEFLGSENVDNLEIWMASEDFAYYAKNYPSVFYRLGIKDTANDNPSPLHSPTFFADEKALITGMSAMAFLAASFLNEF